MTKLNGTQANIDKYNNERGWYIENDSPYKLTWLDVLGVIHLILVFPFWSWFIYNYF